MEKISIQYFKEHVVDTNFQIDSCLYYAIQEQTEVSCGRQNDVNTQFCNEHNIPILQLNRDGGAIVHFQGNVAWAKVGPNSVRDYELTNIRFLKALERYLISKKLNVKREGNDILIDDHKVASGCAINLPPDYKRTFSAVQISINTDIELIKNICTKEMKKIPGALSDYGITTKEMEDFVVNFFDN